MRDTSTTYPAHSSFIHYPSRFIPFPDLVYAIVDAEGSVSLCSPIYAFAGTLFLYKEMKYK